MCVSLSHSQTHVHLVYIHLQESHFGPPEWNFTHYVRADECVVCARVESK